MSGTDESLARSLGVFIFIVTKRRRRKKKKKKKQEKETKEEEMDEKTNAIRNKRALPHPPLQPPPSSFLLADMLSIEVWFLSACVFNLSARTGLI